MTTGQSQPTPRAEPRFVSTVGGGLTYEHATDRDGQDIGLHIYERDRMSLLFQYQHSLGRTGLILTGTSVTSLSKETQAYIGGQLPATPIYTHLNTLAQTLTAELQSDEGKFGVKYGRQWKDGVFDTASLGIYGSYISKDRSLEGNIQAGGDKFALQQATLNASYTKDKTIFTSGISYNPETKSFLPTFAVKMKM